MLLYLDDRKTKLLRLFEVKHGSQHPNVDRMHQNKVVSFTYTIHQAKSIIILCKNILKVVPFTHTIHQAKSIITQRKNI